MGVPGIHLEQTFSPFGEKPGGPFFFRTDSVGEREYPVGAMDDEKGSDIFHHPRTETDNRDVVKIVYNDAKNG